MTREEIQSQIEGEMNKFNMKIFPGTLPKWFLDGFEKIIMDMPQTDVPYRGETIKSILSKQIDHLNIFEVGIVANILLTVAPKYLSTTIEKFLLKKIVLEQIVAEYNGLTNRETERLKRKTISMADAMNKNNASRIIRN